jgi:hypothetical protein
MKKHIVKLMFRSLEEKLNPSDRKKLDKILMDPEALSYYEDVKKLDKALQQKFSREQLAEEIDMEGVPSDEEILEDIRKYGGKQEDEARRIVREIGRRFG